ncbi:MAG: hypothetical protein AAB781_01585 [Patescibacteria group bacterium]
MIFCVFVLTLTFFFLRREELKLNNILKVNIFSLTLEHADAERLKEMLANNGTSYTNVYLEGDAYKMNNCLYYLECHPSGKDNLHIATNRYKDAKSLRKNVLISVFKVEVNDNIKFATVKVLWPQWIEKPGYVLARYLHPKNRKLPTS